MLISSFMQFMVVFLLSCITRRTLATTGRPFVMAELGYSAAYVTVPNEECAKKIAHGAVSGKLAACVNIIPKITSVYEWKGKIEEDSEYLLMIKTRTSKVDALTKFVKENHPYEVCEVISVPIQNGNPDYLKWISEVLPE